jgi:hypothetical protein
MRTFCGDSIMGEHVFSLIAEEFERSPELCELLKLWADGLLSFRDLETHCIRLRKKAAQTIEELYAPKVKA